MTHLQVHGTLPDGIILVKAEGFDEWFMDIKVLDGNPLYANQTFRLKFKFNSSYPIGTIFFRGPTFRHFTDNSH